VERKTLSKVLGGLADKNIRFQDLKKLLSDLGFSVRIKGDHHIFYKEGVEEIVNLQPLSDGKAKAYQVKQVRVSLNTNFIKEFKMYKYELIIFWSAEDGRYVVEVPELPGCMADGKTYEEAIKNAEVVISEWIETARSLGRELPEPKGRLAYA
jgi:predicted RNase H-like HicB family nuclease